MNETTAIPLHLPAAEVVAMTNLLTRLTRKDVNRLARETNNIRYPDGRREADVMWSGLFQLHRDLMAPIVSKETASRLWHLSKEG